MQGPAKYPSCFPYFSALIFFLTALFSCSAREATQVKLTASFTYSPALPVPGQAVQFTDSSKGSPTAWDWNFGDGMTSVAQNPNHSYAAVSSYTVTLDISNGSSSSRTSQAISVRQPGTVAAASPSLADVKAAIGLAEPGDTVVVPAGATTWSGQLVITKGIILKGAGIDQTVITSNYVRGNPEDPQDPRNHLIVYTPANPLLDEPFRLSGFTFDLASKCFGIELRLWPIDDIPLTKIRIDHNKLMNVPTGRPGYNIYIMGPFYGVIDNNQFLGGGAMANSWDSTIWGSPDPRISTFDFGSPNNMYFEDNTFIIEPMDFILMFYGGNGGRYCFRYNYVDGSNLTEGFYPLCDLHGTQGLGHEGSGGTLGAEIYENTIIARQGYTVDQRGGKVLCYNNHATTTSGWVTKVTEEHDDYLGPYPYVSATSGQHKYVTNSYYWGNTRNSRPITEYQIVRTVDYTKYGNGEGIVPRKDVHVWFEPDLVDNYTFDGTRGCGYGLLANRPSSGLKTGVGYWASDQRKLYRATGPTTWELIYTEYPYPHPLRTVLSD